MLRIQDVREMKSVTKCRYSCKKMARESKWLAKKQLTVICDMPTRTLTVSTPAIAINNCGDCFHQLKPITLNVILGLEPEFYMLCFQSRKRDQPLWAQMLWEYFPTCFQTKALINCLRFSLYKNNKQCHSLLHSYCLPSGHTTQLQYLKVKSSLATAAINRS